jgi:RNA polymerase sigma-70 factor, ECF subfamily
MRSTSATLVQRIRDLDDDSGWQRFVLQYRPRLIAWCREKGLRPEEADDVAQDVMARLIRHMPKFTYRPEQNFSGWLRTIWKTAWLDFLRNRRSTQPGLGMGSDGHSTIQSILDRQIGGDLAEELADQMDREHHRHLLAEAMTIVRQEVSSRDWEIFHRITFGEERATNVAKSIGMSLAAVGMIKCRIQKKLALQVQDLDRIK